MKRLLTLLGLLLAGALPLSADEVVLKNGAVFSGVVREQDDTVVVEVDFGTVTFRKSEVRAIRRSDDPLKEFDEKRRVAADVQGYYDLALWARAKGLTTRANDLFRRVISLEPDHEGARKALGYEKHEGKWLTADEAMVARGFVRHNGRWLQRETVEKILEDEKQIRIELERAQASERLARMQRDVEMARIAVERERIEFERQQEDRFHFSWVTRLSDAHCGCGGAHPHTVLVPRFTLPPSVQAPAQPAASRPVPLSAPVGAP